MVVITVQNCTDAKVCTIAVGNGELFWIKMNHVQDGLGVKSISDLVRKGIFQSKNAKGQQIRIYNRTEKELNPECDSNSRFAHSDLKEK